MSQPESVGLESPTWVTSLLDEVIAATTPYSTLA
jgi:hypothetical protein